MGRLQDEYAAVLENADLVAAELAKGLLAESGIPCLLHGPDFDVAELGVTGHMGVRGTSVLVPRSALTRAVAVLRGAWGPDAALARGAGA
jgi:hypothetical protein